MTPYIRSRRHNWLAFPLGLPRAFAETWCCVTEAEVTVDTIIVELPCNIILFSLFFFAVTTYDYEVLWVVQLWPM